MYFHSIPYFCFLPLIVFLCSQLSVEKRWQFITAASLFFYAWHSPHALLFLAAIVVLSFFVGKELQLSDLRARRLFLLWSTFFIFVCIIASAKYLPDSVSGPVLAGGEQIDFLTPIGLSFYTFQAVGYLIDVYRRTTSFQPHFGIHASFICFFPTLLSGPIERADSLIPQIEKPSVEFASERERHLLLFYSGLFKKLVIADALAKFVSPVFQTPEYFNGFSLFLGVALARYMIFADFSGYADMAVASAGFLGIRIRQNFKRPFFATSLIDYWRRWHISLHDWMKDYVFFSLSVTSVGRRLGIYFCLIVSFLFMGVWHDIGPTFLAVGLWHGIFISLDYLTRDSREHLAAEVGLTRFPLLYRISQIGITFIFFVMPPTVFFLSKSLRDVRSIFLNIVQGDWSQTALQNAVSALSGGNPASVRLLIQTLIAVAVVEALHVLQANGGIRNRILRWPIAARATLYIGLFVVLVLYAQTFGERPYVYFQF
jgi:alginate O-acetyltransferase complex protein AlgI